MANGGKMTWDQLTKRLVAISDRECTNRGFAVITVQVLVGADGEPCFCTEPQITKIEPRIGATLFLERILSIIGTNSKNS